MAPFFTKTAAYRAYLHERAKFVNRIIADRKLIPTDKVIAFAVTRFIAPYDWTIDVSRKQVADAVGWSEATVKRSVGRLVAAGYFERHKLPAGSVMSLFPVLDANGNANSDATSRACPVSLDSNENPSAAPRESSPNPREPDYHAGHSPGHSPGHQ